jgi:glycosyltransferase 2 family protein
MASPRSVLRAALPWLVSIALLGLVGRQLARQWSALEAESLSLSPGWAALSFLLLALFMLGMTQAWRMLARTLDQEVDFRTAFYIVVVSNLAKYIPGGLWTVVGRVALARRFGLASGEVLVSVLIETALQLTGAAVVVLGTLFFVVHHPLVSQPALFVAVIAVAVALVHPSVLNFGLGAFARVTRRAAVRIRCSYPFLLKMLAFYTVNWLLLSGGFAALARAVMPGGLTFERVGVLVGGFAFAWSAGTFAFFLPGGLGAREGALMLVFDGSFAPGWSATLAITARVWITIGETALFLVALAAGPSLAAPPAGGEEETSESPAAAGESAR